MRVMDKARLTEFTAPNSNGLERQLRGNGDNLSGGQKQRISLARAMAKQCQVYIYDEATSALDKANEAEIMGELANMAKGKTSLLSSTRATFMKDSTAILVIEGGNLVEKGTYEDLIAKKGFFYRFSK